MGDAELAIAPEGVAVDEAEAALAGVLRSVVVAVSGVSGTGDADAHVCRGACRGDRLKEMGDPKGPAEEWAPTVRWFGVTGPVELDGAGAAGPDDAVPEGAPPEAGGVAEGDGVGRGWISRRRSPCCSSLTRKLSRNGTCVWEAAVFRALSRVAKREAPSGGGAGLEAASVCVGEGAGPEAHATRVRNGAARWGRRISSGPGARTHRSPGATSGTLLRWYA